MGTCHICDPIGRELSEPPPQHVGPVPSSDYPGPLDIEVIGARATPPRRRRASRRHGLLSASFSRTERRKMNALFRRYCDDLQPVGAVSEALVAKLAATSLRMERCARAERHYHRSTWRRRSHVLGEFDSEAFSRTVRLVSRYDTALTNQFLKLLTALARCQAPRAAASQKAANAQAARASQRSKNADSAKTDANP